MEKLLKPEEMPIWFSYPNEFLRIVRQGLLDFDPWIVLVDERLRTRLAGIRERYPSRDIVPFARREDNDDVACWDNRRPGMVVVIHDFASPGYENKQEYNDFWAWFREAIEVMIEYEP
jgi:hypothetical protein